MRSVFDAGRPAMRIPRDRPSNSWWKAMAVTSEATEAWISLVKRDAAGKRNLLNSDPDVIASVKPMTSE